MTHTFCLQPWVNDVMISIVSSVEKKELIMVLNYVVKLVSDYVGLFCIMLLPLDNSFVEFQEKVCIRNSLVAAFLLYG